MLKRLDSTVKAVKFDTEHLIAVLVTACSWIGLCTMGKALVRVRDGGSQRMVGPAAAVMRLAKSVSLLM